MTSSQNVRSFAEEMYADEDEVIFNASNEMVFSSTQKTENINLTIKIPGMDKKRSRNG